jgi:hypothetical protein
VRRRDIPKVLIASAAGNGLPATVARAAPASVRDLAEALGSPGHIQIAEGMFRTAAKLQTVQPHTIIGDSRHNTVILADGLADYVFEVGDGRPGPNAGTIQRLRFYGRAGNLGCLHMNTLSHMWLLSELLFSGGPCPAIVVDNCWDSNYTNIDILGHFSSGTDPAHRASVIFRNGSNNIYCRGLRIEGALSGGIYTDCGPIYACTGKIDDGFGGPQWAPAITVAEGGELVVEDFYLGGMLNQFHVDVAGTLRLGRVVLDGGTNRIAAINDRRAWRHRNRGTYPGISRAATGPELPDLDLGDADFRRYHPSVDTETPAAIYSRIYPIRQVQHLTVRSNGPVHADTITVTTDLAPLHEHEYRNSFLVHNATGTQVGNTGGARRRILDSLPGGVLILHGIQPVTTDSDWSIEYCANHCTPLRLANSRLDRQQELFSVLAREARVMSALAYNSSAADAAYGTTKFRIEGPGLSRGMSLTGLYLIDNETGEPHYIQYGCDALGFIGVMYDRTKDLNPSGTFSVIAGYPAGIQIRGDRVTWTFGGAAHEVRIPQLRSLGYDPDLAPLWAFGPGWRP